MVFTQLESRKVLETLFDQMVKHIKSKDKTDAVETLRSLKDLISLADMTITNTDKKKKKKKSKKRKLDDVETSSIGSAAEVAK